MGALGRKPISLVTVRGVVAQNRIGGHSMNLLTAVATYRENDDSVSFRLSRFR